MRLLCYTAFYRITHAVTLNVVIKLCQVRDVQYDQVAEAIEDLRTALMREYLNTATWFQHKTWTDFVDVRGE